MLQLGVIGKSKKQQEKRVPIHPSQLAEIAPVTRSHMFFENSYGEPFGINDEEIATLSGGVLSREELLESCDIILLAKPTLQDFQEMKKGTIHWGWPHCVQQDAITQTAIDNQLTLIAWEAMHSWSTAGEWQQHSFYRNNEIAGYAGIHHAMNLVGIDGNYGEPKRAVVLSFGSVSHGAIYGLRSRGIQEISVCTFPHDVKIKDRLDGITYHQLKMNQEGFLISSGNEGTELPLIDILAHADIIVNGILQDTDSPLMFVHEEEVANLKKGCLIVDISCDEGMGFPFAIPTSFDNPILQFGSIHYYAVDHTPSYLWNATSWEISKAVIPYLNIVMGGEEEWENDATIRRAIEIKNGRIINPKILSFQNRSELYPHKRL